ncbi:MAG TPA: hypothetical protein VLL52_16945 [Anaerolineae bacterium]|nr:hypothetical protein [Anaerolineae bacterium]
MSVQEYEGINYLVAAAVVNRSFRRLLLRDPSEALAQGYQGVMFVLTDEERAVICEREGRTFAEFLTQIERLNE